MNWSERRSRTVTRIVLRPSGARSRVRGASRPWPPRRAPSACRRSRRGSRPSSRRGAGLDAQQLAAVARPGQRAVGVIPGDGVGLGPTLQRPRLVLNIGSERSSAGAASRRAATTPASAPRRGAPAGLPPLEPQEGDQWQREHRTAQELDPESARRWAPRTAPSGRRSAGAGRPAAPGAARTRAPRRHYAATRRRAGSRAHPRRSSPGRARGPGRSSTAAREPPHARPTVGRAVRRDAPAGRGGTASGISAPPGREGWRRRRASRRRPAARLAPPSDDHAIHAPLGSGG